MARNKQAFGSALEPGFRSYSGSSRRTTSAAQGRQASRFRVVRASTGIRLGWGAWSFTRGDQLDGILLAHPVNAARKTIIRTAQGTFSINEEDLEEL